MNLGLDLELVLFKGWAKIGQFLFQIDNFPGLTFFLEVVVNCLVRQDMRTIESGALLADASRTFSFPSVALKPAVECPLDRLIQSQAQDESQPHEVVRFENKLL